MLHQELRHFSIPYENESFTHHPRILASRRSQAGLRADWSHVPPGHCEKRCGKSVDLVVHGLAHGFFALVVMGIDHRWDFQQSMDFALGIQPSVSPSASRVPWAGACADPRRLHRPCNAPCRPHRRKPRSAAFHATLLALCEAGARGLRWGGELSANHLCQGSGPGTRPRLRLRATAGPKPFPCAGRFRDRLRRRRRRTCGIAHVSRLRQRFLSPAARRASFYRGLFAGGS